MIKNSVFFLIFISLLWKNVETIGRRSTSKPQNCPNNEVQCAPKFTMNMALYEKFDELHEKDDQNFLCPASGNPTPNITWYKDGKNMNKSAQEFSVTVYNIKAHQDDGNYSCVVCNSLGCINHTFKVHIIRDLKILDGPKNASKKIGEKYELRCQHNHPVDEKVRIDWYYASADPFDPVKAPTDDQVETLQKNPDRDILVSTREVEIERENQTGWYTCGVITKERAIYKSAFLKVEPKDDEVANPSVLLSFSGSIVLALLLAIVILIAYHKFRENNPIPPTIMRQYIPAIVIKKQPTSESGSDELKSLFDVFIERRLAPENFDIEEGHQYYEFPKDAEWEFPRERVQLLNSIGEGNFGKVYKAEAYGILKPDTSTVVAVKTLKKGFDDEAAKNLVVETETMKAIGRHKNIINLLGCCTDNGTMMVIMEYAALGNLADFLRTHSYPANNNGNDYVTMGNNLSEDTLLGFALQVAEAMEFLASKKCIHRDLAARNVLVTEDHTMKVADFGLARNVHENDYYRNTTNAQLPIKWMAPESLYHRKYTSQSDVWSFGVVLWELGSMGTPPYRDLTNREVLKGLPDGLRMDKPELFSVESYKLMRDCWSYLPEERPTFTSIVQQLTELIEDIKQKRELPEDFKMDLSSCSESEEEYVESSLYNVPLVEIQVC